MLEALSGLNFFLAVKKVLGGGLALGRLFRLFTQLGMDLGAHTGSAMNDNRGKSKRTSSGPSSSVASASPATSSSLGSGSETLDSCGASACSVPATRDENNEEMLIACCNLNSELVRSHVVTCRGNCRRVFATQMTCPGSPTPTPPRLYFLPALVMWGRVTRFVLYWMTLEVQYESG